MRRRSTPWSSIPPATTATYRRSSTWRASRRCTRPTRSTLARTWRSAWGRTITGSMTFRGTRSPQRWRGSWAAAVRFVTLVVLALVAGACSSELPAATPSGSESSSAAVSPSPTPSASGSEELVPQQVLPPATDPPLAQLCRTPINITSDQNAGPLFCHDGAVNVLAWTYYGAISSSILGLGLNPNNGQP